MSMGNHPNIRIECLRPAVGWVQPTGEEIREVLRLAGSHSEAKTSLTGAKTAKVLGLGAKGDRTVRRWISGESSIPYAAWAILCDLAGFETIWKDH